MNHNENQTLATNEEDKQILVLADMIVDSFLEEKKKNLIEIEAKSQKDYNIGAINKSKGLF